MAIDLNAMFEPDGDLLDTLGNIGDILGTKVMLWMQLGYSELV